MSTFPAPEYSDPLASPAWSTAPDTVTTTLELWGCDWTIVTPSLLLSLLVFLLFSCSCSYSSSTTSSEELNSLGETQISFSTRHSILLSIFFGMIVGSVASLGLHALLPT